MARLRRAIPSHAAHARRGSAQTLGGKMTHRSFPKAIDALGAVVALASCVFAGRIAWEHTVLTWTSGPQMVGFSLMHSGLGVLLYLIALIAGPLWLIAALFFAWRTRSLGTLATRITVITYAVAWAVLSIPAGAWERAFIERMAHSPEAQDLLYYAAVRGDVGTVEAYLARGLSVNAGTCNDALTPIHGAARSGNVEMLTFLISKGADVNATNAYGDSPLCDAEEQNRTAAIELLGNRGAKRIVGTTEQRDAAVTASVSGSLSRAGTCAGARQGVATETSGSRCMGKRWRSHE